MLASLKRYDTCNQMTTSKIKVALPQETPYLALPFGGGD